MAKYYEVKASFEGEIEQLFGSFVREDCESEIDCERDSWKDQGYKTIRIVSRETEDKPDPEVYKDDIESGLLIIEDEQPKPEYIFIWLWGANSGSFSSYIQDQVNKAIEDKAPKTAIFKRSCGKWATIGEMENSVLANRLIEQALNK